MASNLVEPPIKISASIVLYNSKHELISSIINKLLYYRSNIYIYLIDNSHHDDLKVLKDRENICYIHNKSNTGFGDAHNIALKISIKCGFNYHFIINPDVVIKNDVFNPMIDYLFINDDVGIIMPKILNMDGSIQYLPKLLANPIDIIQRKLHLILNKNSIFLKKYELRYIDNQKICNIPIISGCFMLLNLKAIKELGMFDSNFFMYFEDWDLSRRVHKSYKTIYFPFVEIYHHYESGANKNIRLFFIYFSSAIRYFNKWGWFNDAERSIINQITLDEYTNE